MKTKFSAFVHHARLMSDYCNLLAIIDGTPKELRSHFVQDIAVTRLNDHVKRLEECDGFTEKEIEERLLNFESGLHMWLDKDTKLPCAIIRYWGGYQGFVLSRNIDRETLIDCMGKEDYLRMYVAKKDTFPNSDWPAFSIVGVGLESLKDEIKWLAHYIDAVKMPDINALTATRELKAIDYLITSTLAVEPTPTEAEAEVVTDESNGS